MEPVFLAAIKSVFQYLRSAEEISGMPCPVYRFGIAALAFVVTTEISGARANADAPSIILAQAGSAGGTIGKQGKSVSGADEARPAEKSKPTVPAGSAGMPERSAATSINGRWLVSQRCSHGKFSIELDIQQTSTTQFSGTSLGLTTGARSQIVDGRIDGSNVTFSRRAAGLSDRWSARLTGAGRLTGTSSGPAWRCTYTAARR